LFAFAAVTNCLYIYVSDVQFVIIFNSTILDASFVQNLNRLLRRVVRAGGDPNLFGVGELAFAPRGKYTVGYYLARYVAYYY